MKFSEATELHRKSGVWGTRGSWRVGGFENQETRKASGVCDSLEEGDRWASPIVFVPRTLGRTWGTRPISFDVCMARYFCRRLFMTMASMAPAGVT
jgi:hypothetical protein